MASRDTQAPSGSSTGQNGSSPANGARPGKAISSANGANGGNGAKNGATNGAKRGAASPLQQRAVDRDFRDVLTKGLAACRRKLVVVAVFSLCANLLILSLPI
jgi:ATP-binding cassette subfamily C protein